MPVEVKITMSLGLSYLQSTSRTAELADADDLLSLTQLTENMAINGKVATTIFDKSILTYTTITPEGRETFTLLFCNINDNWRV